MKDGFRVCAIVPTYDNPLTIEAVVKDIRNTLGDVIVVDDGSHDEGRIACRGLADKHLARLYRLEKNQGKGAALKIGFRAALDLGFTHAVQVDGDSQHDIARLPDFLRHAEENPEALILGYPVYDETVPKVRLIGRRFTSLWVRLELGPSHRVEDAMVGFRVYPLEEALEARALGNRMEFDIEVLVKMARNGVPIVNLPVGIRYLKPEEGGVSHFRLFRDNLSFSWLHTRLCTAGILRWAKRLTVG